MTKSIQPNQQPANQVHAPAADPSSHDHAARENEPLMEMTRIQPIQFKLSVGAPDDPLESEADAVADKVMRMPEAGFIQRKCTHCEEEERAQRKPLASFIQKKGMEGGSTVSDGLNEQINSTRGTGNRMDTNTRSFMENRFGTDFSSVNIHTGNEAVQMSSELNAQAFTVGNDIYFNSGKYDPGTDSGKHLLAHELTHTVQQGNNIQRIQRTTHSGAACNCHNWLIGLPPWIAGTYAHGQIAALLLAGGIHPQAIPRATKRAMGTPLPPSGTMIGFADLWKDTGTNVNIAEIKSTATGDVPARAEAGHYILRHNEWLARFASGTATDMPDTVYSAMVGGPKPGGILDISGITGTGIPIGPFVADPTKLLWMEGDNLGSVVYWCTGLLDPVLMAILAAAIAALKAMLDAAKRAMDEALVLARAALRWLADNWQYVLLAILLIVAIILIVIFAEAILAFLAAVAAAVVTAMEAAALILTEAFAGFAMALSLLALAGISLPGAGSAGTDLKNGLLALRPGSSGGAQGSDYERDTNNGSSYPSSGPSSGQLLDPGTRLLSSMSPLANPVNLYEAARGSASLRNPKTIAAVRGGITRIGTSGQSSLSASLMDTLNEAVS